MFNKNDPLIASVTKVMQENQVRRDVVDAINEAFGITDKRHLPFQAHAEYDALVEEMTKEALVGNQHKLDVNKNGRLDGNDFKSLGGMRKKSMEEGKMKDIATDKAEKERLAQMKKMEEESLDEITSRLVGRAANIAGRRADFHGDNNQHKLANALGKQSERLWAAAEKKRKKENAEKEDQAMSSGKRAKMNKEEAIKEERGKKVAGAILAKMRAKAGMEEEKLDEFITMPSKTNNAPKQGVITMPDNKPTPAQNFNQSKINQAGDAINKFVRSTPDPKLRSDRQANVNQMNKMAEPVLKKQGLTPPASAQKPVPASTPSADAGKNAAVSRMQAQRNAARTGPDANMAPKTGMTAKPAAPAAKPAKKPAQKIPAGMHMRISNFKGGTGLRSNAIIGGGRNNGGGGGRNK